MLTAANIETVIGHVSDGALSLSTTAAVRAAVLAGAAPAVISELAVADDLAAGRLVEVRTPGLDLPRALRAIWAGTPAPPAGPARDRSPVSPGDQELVRPKPGRRRR